MAIPGTSWFEALKQAESGGRNIGQQVNATGSAFGPYQFTAGTWNDLIRRHPELQLTSADRFDPVAQERAVRAFTADNAQALRAGGVAPTPDALVAAHRFGAGGALQLASANPNAPLSAVLPAAAAANPGWANRSAGDLFGGRRSYQGFSPMDQSLSQQSLDAGRQLAFNNLNPDLRGMVGAMLLSPTMHDQGLRLVESIITGGGKSPLDEFATRSQAAQQYGLTPGSDAHREYVLTGKLPQPPAEKSPFGSISPKDYTSESLKAFKQSGDYTDLVPRETPPAEKDQFVGAPFPGPNGEMLVRDKQGSLFVLTDKGPMPFQGAQMPAQQAPAGPQAPGPYGGATPLREPPKPLTESESKNTAWYDRMSLGEQNINKFFDKNPDYLQSSQAKWDQFAREAGNEAGKAAGGAGAVIGGGVGLLGGPAGVGAGIAGGGALGYGLGELLGPTLERFLTSDAGKQYQASAAPFVNAALRKDTGAQINNQEWTYAFKEWLPMPGDSAEVQRIKAENRAAALEGARVGAGTGVKAPTAPQVGDILRSINQQRGTVNLGKGFERAW